jgi:hypothetical protein
MVRRVTVIVADFTLPEESRWTELVALTDNTVSSCTSQLGSQIIGYGAAKQSVSRDGPGAELRLVISRSETKSNKAYLESCRSYLEGDTSEAALKNLALSPAIVHELIFQVKDGSLQPTKATKELLARFALASD